MVGLSKLGLGLILTLWLRVSFYLMAGCGSRIALPLSYSHSSEAGKCKFVLSEVLYSWL